VVLMNVTALSSLRSARLMPLPMMAFCLYSGWRVNPKQLFKVGQQNAYSKKASPACCSGELHFSVLLTYARSVICGVSLDRSNRRKAFLIMVRPKQCAQTVWIARTLHRTMQLNGGTSR